MIPATQLPLISRRFYGFFILFLCLQVDLRRFKCVTSFGFAHLLAANVCLLLRVVVREILRDVTFWRRTLEIVSQSPDENATQVRISSLALHKPIITSEIIRQPARKLTDSVLVCFEISLIRCECCCRRTAAIFSRHKPLTWQRVRRASAS